MAHPHNSGSTVRFCAVKGAVVGVRFMKMFLVFFFLVKKFHLGQFDPFRPFFTV